MGERAGISFSVVIPTLGSRPSALAQAVRNATEQSFPPTEVIVVMNGPPDVELPNLGKATVVKAPVGLGTARARNLGASLASTSHVAFLDDDDLWARDYLWQAKKFLEQGHSLSTLVGTILAIENEGLVTSKNPEGFLEVDILLRRNPGVTGSNVVVARDKFLASSGYRSTLKSGADKSLIIDLLLEGQAIEVVTTMISIRREDWSGSVSRSQVAAAKIHFLLTFWSRMSFGTRFQLVLQSARLWLFPSRR